MRKADDNTTKLMNETFNGSELGKAIILEACTKDINREFGLSLSTNEVAKVWEDLNSGDARLLAAVYLASLSVSGYLPAVKQIGRITHENDQHTDGEGNKTGGC